MINIDDFLQNNKRYIKHLDIINPNYTEILNPFFEDENLIGVSYSLNLYKNKNTIIDYNPFIDILQLDYAYKEEFILLVNDVKCEYNTSVIPKFAIPFTEVKFINKNFNIFETQLKLKVFTLNNTCRNELKWKSLINNYGLKFENGVVI